MAERSPQRPHYRRIADELREDIDQGRLLPGDQLPIEPDLEKTYGVSRNTVRQALSVLINEGLLIAERGRGTFVRERAMLTYTASGVGTLDSEHEPEYVSEVESQHRKPSGGRLEMIVLPASSRVAERLHMRQDELVVRRTVVRSVDGTAALLQRSYYPMDIAQGTELIKPADIKRGTVQVLKELGHEQVGQRDELLSRMPTPEESGILELGPGATVLEHYRTAYSVSRPIRLTHQIFAGDRFRIVYNEGDLSAQQLEEDADEMPQ